jgi:hypothetical protein
MRRLGVLCFLLAAWAANSAVASAAMWIRIEVAGTPIAGQLTHVSVITGVIRESGKCAADPGFEPWADWYPGGGPATVRLVVYPEARSEQSREVQLSLRAGDPARHDGEVRFPEPGRWTLRVIQPDFGQSGPDAEACAGARRTVDVLPASLPTTSTRSRSIVSAEILVAGLLLAAVAALGLRLRLVRQ